MRNRYLLILPANILKSENFRVLQSLTLFHSGDGGGQPRLRPPFLPRSTRKRPPCVGDRGGKEQGNCAPPQ
jgi:hypothetical protein